jgi:hypothetical protein
MPFSPNASIISTDLDNMLRGIYRDNADHALTGVLTETTIGTVTINGGIIGQTGGLKLEAAGTLAGVAGTKTIRLYFGTAVVATILQAAGTTSDWYFNATMMNASAGAQRWKIERNGNDLLTSTFDYITSAQDTNGNVVVKVTGQLRNAGDTITGTMLDLFVVQIQ